MIVTMRKISEIRPYPHNPRINDRAIDAVAASIRAFGWRQPIVVDEVGEIIAGHTRYWAALKLRLTEVPVHVATGLTPEQVKACRIADNKTGELADWDYHLLTRELADLQGFDFDLSLLGLSADELTGLLDEEVLPGLADPDDVPQPPAQAVTQPGDLWTHRGHTHSHGRWRLRAAEDPADLRASLGFSAQASRGARGLGARFRTRQRCDRQGGKTIDGLTQRSVSGPALPPSHPRGHTVLRVIDRAT